MGLTDVKEGGISARKAGLLWGLSMKKSTLQVRLNRRLTFDRRIDVPSPSFFSNKKWGKKFVCRLVNWACKLRLRHVHGCLPLISEKVPRQGSENYTIFKTAARVPHHTPVICSVLFHDARLYSWNRLPDYFASAREAYKSLACRNLCTITLLLLCPDTGPAVRILGNVGALQKC